jgi:transcriptional regulator with XRE-family HTH domain
MNSIELGSLIQRRRAALQIDQNALAELSGVSIHTVSNVESGRGNPTLKIINSLLDVLGLELVVRPRASGDAE